jgi:hypothetical protein
MKKTIIISICIILVCIVFILSKNCLTYKIKKTYGLSGVVKEKKIDNLFVGSSVFRQGLDIKIIEQEMPGNSYILAYNGNQPCMIKMELQHLINYSTNIKTVYMDLYPLSASEKPSLSDSRLIWDFNFHEKLSAWDYLTGKRHYGFKTWYEFWILSNNEIFLTYPVSSHFINKRYYKGGSVQNTPGNTKKNLDNLSIPDFEKEMNNSQKESILEIKSICEKGNIHFVLIELPKYNKLQNDKNYESLRKEYFYFLHDNNIEYINSEKIDFDNNNPYYYQDLIHLSSEGARIIGKKIINSLNRSL